MINLDETQYRIVYALIKDINHNRAAIYAVVDNSTPGHIWVDNVTNPTCAMIHPENMFWYILGNPPVSNEFIESAISIWREHSKHESIEIFTFSQKWHLLLDKLLKKYNKINITRCIYTFDESAYREMFKNRFDVPQGMVSNYWDSNADNVQNEILELLSAFPSAKVWAILKGDTLVSHSEIICIGDEVAEIGVETHPNYRRKGMAVKVIDLLINYCLEKDLSPEWGCWKDNTPSCALAEKMCFKLSNEVTVFYLPMN